MLDNNNFVLQQITKLHDASKFSLGNPSFTPLKIFLQKNAFDFHQYEVAKTFVLINSEISVSRIFGYVTLVMSEICLDKNQRPAETAMISNYKSYPAAKIARLAIDKNLQSKGSGRVLLDWSMSLLQANIMPYIGCRYLVVDAKQESIGFYQKNGFVFLAVENNSMEEHPKMFFDLYKSNRSVNQNKYNDKLSAIVSV